MKSYYSFINVDNDPKKKIHGSNYLEIKKIDYFKIIDFNEYRKNMIKKIDINEVTTSFSELKNIGKSLKNLMMESGSVEDIIFEYELKKQKELSLEQEIIPQKTPEINNSNSKFKTQIEKSEKSEAENEELLKREEIIEENLQNILENLQTYISSNIKEIKDFRDVVSKSDNYLEIQNNQMIKSDESYENTPLATNSITLQAKLESSKYDKIIEENIDQENEMDDISNEILKIESKANQLEINSLITKIQTMNKLIQVKNDDILSIDNQKNTLIENLKNTYVCGLLEMTKLFNDEDNELDNEQGYYADFFEKFLCIDEEKWIFFENYNKLEVFLEFEHENLSDISNILNSQPVIFKNIFDDNEEGFFNKMDESLFTGYKLKFWKDGTLKCIYIKTIEKTQFEKFDHCFFIMNLRKSLKSSEFLVKNQKFINTLATGINEDFEKFSQITVSGKKIRFSKIGSDPRIREEIENKSPNLKKSIMNLENKKKKVTHFNLEGNKEKKIQNFPTNEYLFQNFASTKSKEDLYKDFTDSRVERIDKLHDIALKEQQIFEKKQIKLENHEYKYSKAIKTLKNGFLFLKISNSDKQERIIYLDSKETSLEIKALDKIKKEKSIKLEEITNLQIGTNNNKKIKNCNEKLFFSIIYKSSNFDLEASRQEDIEKFKKCLYIVLDIKY